MFYASFSSIWAGLQFRGEHVDFCSYLHSWGLLIFHFKRSIFCLVWNCLSLLFKLVNLSLWVFQCVFVFSGRSSISFVFLLAWCCPCRCSFTWSKWALSTSVGDVTSSGSSYLARLGFASNCPCLFIVRSVYSRLWLALKKTWVGPVLLSFGTPLTLVSPIS